MINPWVTVFPIQVTINRRKAILSIRLQFQELFREDF